MNAAASATGQDRYAYVAGTFDTKAKELDYLRNCLADMAVRVRTIDLSAPVVASSPVVPTADRPEEAPVAEADEVSSQATVTEFRPRAVGE